jgi:hypothetical protein
MSLLSWIAGTGIIWTRNESWVISCGRRTLEAFTPQTEIRQDFGYISGLPATKRPRKVRPRLDVDFRFVDAKIVIDAVRMAKFSPNCEISGRDVDLTDDCMNKKMFLALLQQEADTKKSTIRSDIIRMLHEEQEASGRKYVTGDASPP